MENLFGQSVEILNDLNTVTLKQIFWKTKIFFQKAGVFRLKAVFQLRHKDW